MLPLIAMLTLPFFAQSMHTPHRPPKNKSISERDRLRIEVLKKLYYRAQKEREEEFWGKNRSSSLSRTQSLPEIDALLNLINPLYHHLLEEQPAWPPYQEISQS